jgi:rhodanese-related sulfurtransferase
MEKVIIDVRENDEYRSEHIENSIHVPLGDFQLKAKEILENLRSKEVVLMCRSGKRAKIAYNQARALGLEKIVPISIFEGGILEWKNQNNPTIGTQPGHFPIMRQVQIVAGSLILTSIALALIFHIGFLALGGFVGMGLTFAGITGFCGMAELLNQMPWNKSYKSGDPKSP